MSQPAKAQEPSMEEILASIRRIIADDDATKTTRPPEPAPPKPAPAAAVPTRPAPPPAPPRAPPPRPAAPLATLDQDAVDKVMAEPDPPPAMKPAGDDILDLTESMAMQAEPPSAAPSFRTIDGESDIVFSDRPPEPAPHAVEEAKRQYVETVATDRTIISHTTAAAVDSAFNSLANTVLGQNARTLEDLVKEMLRPMLKGWLDDNLPGLVERIVRAEIERVSRGR